MQKNIDTGSIDRRKQAILWLLVPVTLLVIFDEWIKAWGLSLFPSESLLSHPGIVSLAIHKNWGIAFDIPFKMSFVIFISVAIGLVLLTVAVRNIRQNPPVALASLMIVLGALGNLYDRLAYGFTVDYLIFFGRSAINISDTIIVVGVLTVLYASRVRPSPEQHIDNEQES